MCPAANGGSLIIPNRSGHLPGIQGRLNPTLDNLDRTYLYADNVAINDGQQQPVHFNLNEPVRLTDSMGAGATLWFRRRWLTAHRSPVDPSEIVTAHGAWRVCRAASTSSSKLG